MKSKTIFEVAEEWSEILAATNQLENSSLRAVVKSKTSEKCVFLTKHRDSNRNVVGYSCVEAVMTGRNSCSAVGTATAPMGIEATKAFLEKSLL